MAIQNTFYLDVDIKRDNYVEEPQVTQNDDVAFVLRLTDDGIDMSIEGVSTYTLASLRADGQSVLTVGTLTGPNEVTFELGSTEVSVPGRVKAAIQLYDVDGRVSSIPFTYEVTKDLATNYLPSKDEQTLIELVLGEGPVILADARKATVDANQATSDLTVLKAEVIDATDNANTAANHATTEGNRAGAQADRADTAATNAEGVYNAILPVLPNIEGWGYDPIPYDPATTYERNNIVGHAGSTYISLLDGNVGNTPTLATPNANWGVLARRGIDGKGAVSSVNGVGPDASGDVTITIPDPDLSGLATKAELQALDDDVFVQLNEKATKSDVLRKVDKDYVDNELASKADSLYVNTQLSAVASGSPKRVFSTLASLQAFYPAGNTGIYVVSQDGKWYFWDGSGWVAGGTYQSTGIGLNTIQPEHLSFETIYKKPGKNLFDKNRASIGYYIEHTSGELLPNSEYFTSDFIKVLPNNTYTRNSINRVVYFDSEKRYISGVVSTPDLIFTTPANASFVRITEFLGGINFLQLEKGVTKTPFEPYRESFNYQLGYENLIVVAKSGGEYATINDAISSSNDSKENPVTILIMPGTYVESLNLIGRYISLVGINKNTCIIKTYTNDYFNPPIDLSANSHLSNLTIIADDDEVATPPNGVDGMKSYAVHHDIAGRGYDISNPIHQGVSRVENCILISKFSHAAGIGVSHKQHLIFESCEFISFDSPSFRAHNYLPAGATDQKMTVNNCVMRNNGTISPIVIQDANNYGGGMDNRDTVFTFRNNVAYSEDGGQANGLSVDGFPPLDSESISGYIKLGKGSFGNSVPQLNI